MSDPTNICPNCGKTVEEAGESLRRVLCSECRRKRKREAESRRRRKAREARRERGEVIPGRRFIEVTYCPENFFPCGGRFAVNEFVSGHGIRSGAPVFDCWIPGMVIRDLRNGMQYQVGDDYRLSQRVTV